MPLSSIIPGLHSPSDRDKADSSNLHPDTSDASTQTPTDPNHRFSSSPESPTFPHHQGNTPAHPEMSYFPHKSETYINGRGELVYEGMGFMNPKSESQIASEKQHAENWKKRLEDKVGGKRTDYSDKGNETWEKIDIGAGNQSGKSG